jgi:hypothetical protein
VLLIYHKNNYLSSHHQKCAFFGLNTKKEFNMATVSELDAKIGSLANSYGLAVDQASRTTDPALKAALENEARTYVAEIEKVSRQRTELIQATVTPDVTAAPPATEPTPVNQVAVPQTVPSLEDIGAPVVEVPDNPIATLDLTGAQPAPETKIAQVEKNTQDWRCRIRLAKNSDYLYNAPSESVGILAPLRETNGVIFPYTPRIDTIYRASYESRQLPHSNFVGHFYQGSSAGEITISATFTAQDTYEAKYMLAVIHFFRSATKMFYGNDVQRGAPPPILFLSAFGEHQYNNVPCVLADFNYNLPDNVDYIPTKARAQNFQSPDTVEPKAKGLDRIIKYVEPALNRLAGAALSKGGFSISGFSTEMIIGGSSKKSIFGSPSKNTTPFFADAPATNESLSYVPTRIDLTLTMSVLQTREQMSKEFSLRDYASGKLITKGYQ